MIHTKVNYHTWEKLDYFRDPNFFAKKFRNCALVATLPIVEFCNQRQNWFKLWSNFLATNFVQLCENTSVFFHILILKEIISAILDCKIVTFIMFVNNNTTEFASDHSLFVDQYSLKIILFLLKIAEVFWNPTCK